MSFNGFLEFFQKGKVGSGIHLRAHNKVLMVLFVLFVFVLFQSYCLFCHPHLGFNCPDRYFLLHVFFFCCIYFEFVIS